MHCDQPKRDILEGGGRSPMARLPVSTETVKADQLGWQQASVLLALTGAVACIGGQHCLPTSSSMRAPV